MKLRKKGIILVLFIIIIFFIGLLVNNIMINNKDIVKLKKKIVVVVKKKKEIFLKLKELFNIDFIGDIMFDWDLCFVLVEKGMDYFFNNVCEELKLSDYIFVDLEIVIIIWIKKVFY